MKTRIQAAAVAAAFCISSYYAVRQARYWSTQELSPFHRHLHTLHANLPEDARILLLLPESLRRSSTVQHAGARLHPRPVFLLPGGASTLEDARAWIAEKRITWVVSLGGPEFDAAKAFARRLDDGR